MQQSRHRVFTRLTCGGAISLLALAAAQAQAQEAAAPADAASPTVAENAASEEAIVVTGSRIARSGFNAPTPVTVIGQERLDKRAITNVGDALNELPLFRPLVTPATQQAVGGNVGARILDLRGLGGTRTLVLVDGKRFVPSTTQGTIDVNLIPTSLIQRTEVVTGGASAAYGSDAVAGVVNFILDHDLTGLRASFQGGVSERGDAQEYSASLAYGSRFADDRGHFMIAGEYVDSKGMGDCYTRDWCPNEQLIGNSSPGLNGIPTSVRAGPAGTDTLSSGGLIVVPSGPLRGISFNPDGSINPYDYGTIFGTNPSPLFALGGEESGRNAFLDGILLIPPVERIVGFASIGYEFSDALKASLDMSYGRVEGTVIGSVARSTVTITRDNAYLPASVAAIMDANGITSFSLGRGFGDLGGSVNNAKNETYRAVLSLDGRISDNWRWDAYYQYGRNEFSQVYSGNIINTRVTRAADAVFVGSNIVCRVNADTSTTNDDPACSPLNIFGSGNVSAAADAYVAPTGFQTTDTDQHVLAANINGSLFDLPGGALAIAAGAEYRNDEATGTADALSTANAFWSFNGKAVNGEIEVMEGYVEAVAPLLRDVSFAELLELNGAVRQTHYKRSSPGVDSTSVDVTTWKVGAIYEPVQGLRFRATRSRDIRAPNLTELFGPVSAGRTTVIDPANNGQQIQINSLTGANPELDPEKADTWTVGAVFSPTWDFLRSFRFSVDYYDIKIKGAIATLGAQVIVQRCAQESLFCDLVQRDSAGQLVQVSDVLQNVSEVVNRGIDFEASYDTGIGSLGNLNFRLLATKYLELSVSGVDRAGQTGFRPGTTTGVPDWIVDGTVNWKFDNYTLGVHGRYIPEGKFDVLLLGPEDDGYDPALASSVSSNRVSDRFYLDLNASVQVTENFEFFGVVNNLFDKDPPLAASAQGGTNQVYFDPIGRAFKFGARFRM